MCFRIKPFVFRRLFAKRSYLESNIDKIDCRAVFGIGWSLPHAAKSRRWKLFFDLPFSAGCVTFFFSPSCWLFILATQFFRSNRINHRSDFDQRSLPTMATNSIKLLTGNSHPELAKLMADRYDHNPSD